MTETFEIRNRFTNAVQTRKPSPRSSRAVRARIVHTSAQKRRLDIFVTEPVHKDANWKVGGTVSAQFAVDSDGFYIRMEPAHSGLKASPQNSSSRTVRVAVSGAPIKNGLCAKVCDVQFEIMGSSIVARLPLDWARAELEAGAVA